VEPTGKVFLKAIAAIAAAGGWVWFWHGFTARLASGFRITSAYIFGAFLFGSIAAWLVGKIYAIVTKDSTDI
jgi:hypothetical protein